jgi:L-fuconolactonase
VRQVLHPDDAPSGLCLEAEFITSIQLLGELGKSYDICIRPTELGDAVQLVDRCPETRFIIDHCGNADPKAFLEDPKEEPWHDADDWRQGMAKLADRRNTICKISGIVARVPKVGWGAETLAPIVNHCLDVFGAERVVFGGDWPVCLLGASYASWVSALKEIISERPVPEQQKLLHDNAERLYGLG